MSAVLNLWCQQRGIAEMEEMDICVQTSWFLKFCLKSYRRRRNNDDDDDYDDDDDDDDDDEDDDDDDKDEDDVEERETKEAHKKLKIVCVVAAKERSRS
ncbi:hypothetical protein V2J09_009492 [Rumex salicifolius]